MLTDPGQAEVDIEGGGPQNRGAINFILIALMVLVCAGAFTTLQRTDGFYSEDGAGLGGIIDLKEAVARHQEQEYTYEELKKQKRFGSLTISSTPKGALICTDKATLSRMNLDEKSKAALKKCPNANERGDTLYQLTTAPGNINGIDIAHMLPLVAQREGYQDFPMYIGTHLWPVNQGNEAQYVRVFKMVPKECNRWQTNDSQLGTLSFYSYMHCEQYTKGIQRKKKATRTTDGCVCNPEVIDLAKAEEEKEEVKVQEMNAEASRWWSELRHAPKLVCLARTFPKHAEELGNPIPQEPIFFLKAPSTLIGDGETIVLPAESQLVHHEAEIALIVSRELMQADELDAAAAIQGYTILNDVTARDIQRAEGGRFGRAKSFDTFCPMSDRLVTDVPWQTLSVGCSVNGQQRQFGRLTQMSKTPIQLLAWVSHQMTLHPGDIVSLGTPSGVESVTRWRSVSDLALRR